MLRYTTDRARPGLVAFYDIRPGNGAGLFLQHGSPHRAGIRKGIQPNCSRAWQKTFFTHDHVGTFVRE